MKRALSLLLALVLCLSLCACGGKNQQNEPVETISIDSLLSDMDNGAKAQLNVGKATTIYGQISSVGSSSCTVQLIKPKGSSVFVEMPIEQLAELNKDQFIAVNGIITSCAIKYTITATETLDLELMDSYIREEITKTSAMRSLIEFSGDTNAGMFHSMFHDYYNVSILEDYVYSRGKEFLITDDTALKEYLIGNWVYYQNFGGLDTLTLEYKNDGTSVWYYKNNFDSKVDQCDDWSVSNGVIDSIWQYPEKVYVLNDDVFLIRDYYLLIRIK